MRKDLNLTTHSADGAALVYYRWSDDGCTAFFLFFFFLFFKNLSMLRLRLPSTFFI